jgi:hypothetical protein
LWTWISFCVTMLNFRWKYRQKFIDTFMWVYCQNDELMYEFYYIISLVNIYFYISSSSLHMRHKIKWNKIKYNKKSLCKNMKLICKRLLMMRIADDFWQCQQIFRCNENNIWTMKIKTAKYFHTYSHTCLPHENETICFSQQHDLIIDFVRNEMKLNSFTHLTFVWPAWQLLSTFIVTFLRQCEKISRLFEPCYWT